MFEQMGEAVGVENGEPEPVNPKWQMTGPGSFTLPGDPADPVLTRDVERVNGFAVGDRVGVVDGPYKGGYGKVEESKPGCSWQECREHCRLVHVDLAVIPAGADNERYRSCRGGPNVRRFKVGEVTHVD